ncbi:MAG: DUF3037 domain-containing protein [Terriglobales bacterium]
MADKRQCEFFLLRYVPNAVQDEFVNVGVVMLEPGGDFADVKFTRDWRRVRCLDPQVDIEMLQALEHDMKRELSGNQARDVLLRRLNDSASNLIQVSPTKACLTEDPAKEIATLAKLYFEGPKPAARTEQSVRKRLYKEIDQAFERAGIAKLIMHWIPVAPYTRPGDPFKFDFGYRVGNTIKIFQAVSMKSSIDQAVLLAARYPAIAEGIGRKIQALPLLTAVTEDDLDRTQEQMQFALGMLEQAQIRVAISAEMPRLAEQARKELMSAGEAAN